MIPADRARVEKAARKAGWNNHAPEECDYCCDGAPEEWVWVITTNDMGDSGWIGGWTREQVYLLAARLLGVRLSGGRKR